VLPRMLFCKLLRSHEPHAIIKSIEKICLSLTAFCLSVRTSTRSA
jgi:hypothetical protein